jgi:hypothetical protein
MTGILQSQLGRDRAGTLPSPQHETALISEFLVRGLLDKALLPGQEGVLSEENVSCEVTNWQGSVNDTLGAFQRTGEAVACIGLTLTGDYRKVHQGSLVGVTLSGDLVCPWSPNACVCYLTFLYGDYYTPVGHWREQSRISLPLFYVISSLYVICCGVLGA